MPKSVTRSSKLGAAERAAAFEVLKAKELDILVELARKHPACLGARLTGGGFGGATINMITHHEAESFIAHMTAGYEKQTGVKMKPLVCQVVDGAN